MYNAMIVHNDDDCIHVLKKTCVHFKYIINCIQCQHCTQPKQFVNCTQSKQFVNFQIKNICLQIINHMFLILSICIIFTC